MYRPTKKEAANFPKELMPLREIIAGNIHDAWAAGRLDEGWRFGECLDAQHKTHPCLRPYEELPESEKEYDRRTAEAAICCILDHGWHITRTDN